MVRSGSKWNKIDERGAKMFIGEYTHAIDPKNRIVIPSKFREDLGNSFVITKGLDGCLYVYTKDEWSVFENKLKTLPLTNKNARAFSRFFFAGACEGSIDKQGRVLIPSNLLQYANIEKDIVSIGVATRIEIWSLDSWNKYNEENIDFDDIAENMTELGLI